MKARSDEPERFYVGCHNQLGRRKGDHHWLSRSPPMATPTRIQQRAAKEGRRNAAQRGLYNPPAATRLSLEPKWL
eukprot:12934684-Prorocentrum_lima.AAC.1